MCHWKEEKYANKERNLQVKAGPVVAAIALPRFSAVFHVISASQAAEKERAEEVEVAFALVVENFWAEATALDR